MARLGSALPPPSTPDPEAWARGVSIAAVSSRNRTSTELKCGSSLRVDVRVNENNSIA
jgi:hypothetical protein